MNKWSTGPDAPLNNFDLIDDNDDRVSFDTLGQLMRFNVSLGEYTEDISTDPQDLCFDTTPGGIDHHYGQGVGNQRQVYLIEETSSNDALGPKAVLLSNERVCNFIHLSSTTSCAFIIVLILSFYPFRKMENSGQILSQR